MKNTEILMNCLNEEIADGKERDLTKGFLIFQF